MSPFFGTRTGDMMSPHLHDKREKYAISYLWEKCTKYGTAWEAGKKIHEL